MHHKVPCGVVGAIRCRTVLYNAVRCCAKSYVASKEFYSHVRPYVKRCMYEVYFVRDVQGAFFEYNNEHISALRRTSRFGFAGVSNALNLK